MSTDNRTLYLWRREDAVHDGTLIDVTPTAQEAAIRHPTFLTREVWRRYVEVSQKMFRETERNRLWTIIWSLRGAIKHAHRESLLLFSIPIRNERKIPELVTLKAFGCRDDTGPYIIVLLPGEG